MLNSFGGLNLFRLLNGFLVLLLVSFPRPLCGAEQRAAKREGSLVAGLPGSTHLKRGPQSQSSNDRILLNVRGNLALSAELLLGALDLPETEDKDDLEMVVREQIRNLYRSRGFMKASVEQVSVIPGDPKMVELRVNEGDVYRYGEVEFQGVESLPVEELQALMPADGTTVDLNTLEAILMDLLRLYRDRGFLDVRFAGLIPNGSETQETDFKLQVEEGPQFCIRSIVCPPTLKLTSRVGEPFSERLLVEFLEAQGLSRNNLILRMDRDSAEVDVVVRSFPTMREGG